MTATVDTAGRDIGRLPALHYDFTRTVPLLSYYTEFDELRERYGMFWNTLAQGFWSVLRYAEVREIFETPEVFRSDSQDPMNPEPAQRFVPTQLNDEEHVQYRRLLTAWFSPRSIGGIRDTAREVAARLVDAVADRGSCDFVTDFALRYPTEVFLRMTGLPAEDVERFEPWLDTMFKGYHTTDHSTMDIAAASIKGYFRDRISERRSHPLDPQRDFVSFAMGAKIFDRPCTDDEILDLLWTLALAGLHTTRVQLVYLMHHLAATPSDREAVVADPSLNRPVIEESMRVHPLVAVLGRKLARDIDFHGAPMRQGDMVWVSVAAANRDPRVFEDAARFDLRRKNTAHMTFGAGPHRCLGAHLARAEMTIALEEWHARIPDYWVRPGASLTERGGLLTPQGLPLAW